MYYIVKCFGRTETRLPQQFKAQEEAVIFIQENLRQDQHFKLVATYRLHEWDEILQEFSQEDILSTQASSATTDSSTSQQSSGSRFNPSPFNTSPRPPTVPHGSIKEDPDNKKPE